MKLHRSTVAIGAALSVVSVAGVAEAGGPGLVAIDGAPSTSTVGQPVTITATLTSPATCPIAIVDVTNGNAPL